MTSKWFYLCSLLIFLHFLLLLSFTEETEVLKIHYSQIYSGLYSKKFLVVLFYSHGCEACREASPHFKEVANDEQLSREILLGAVDIFSEQVLAMHYNIKHVPVIFFLPFGYQNPIQYRGRITKAELLNEIKFQWQKYTNNPPTPPIISPSEGDDNDDHLCKLIDPTNFAKYILNPKIHVLAMFFASPCNKNCEIMEQVAKVFKNDGNIQFYKMDIIKAPKIVSHFKLRENPSAVWFPISDKTYGTVFRDKSFSIELLVNFINKNSGNTRNIDGTLQPKSGRIPELDHIISQHISDILIQKNLKVILEKLEAEAEKLSQPRRFKDYYVTIIKEIQKGRKCEKILEKEQNFILEKLKIKTLSQRAKDDWKKYFNIVGAFIDATENFFNNTVFNDPAVQVKKTLKTKNDEDILSIKRVKEMTSKFLHNQRLKRDEL